jgi:hypothetical protein
MVMAGCQGFFGEDIKQIAVAQNLEDAVSSPIGGADQGFGDGHLVGIAIGKGDRGAVEKNHQDGDGGE